VARVSQGDGEAFEQLVAIYHVRVFHLVRGILGDWHRSEDVCQEVFTTVFRKASNFRGQSQFSTWLYRVAVNAALKARRGRTREEYPVDQVEVMATSPSAPRFEAQEVVDRLLRPLPESLRTAVLLRETADLSYKEIANVLGCTVGAVEQRLHRAMTRLRELWKDDLEAN
jgi:RNA polymerase sigma-70 factor (ECF subfamily)